MTIGELAKKRGQPVGEFVKTLQNLGVNAGSHAKKLTQAELDQVIELLEGTTSEAVVEEVTVQESSEPERDAVVANPNVLMIKLDDRRTLISYVDASVDADGKIKLRVLESSIETTPGETLLEFRKQLGSKLGVN